MRRKRMICVRKYEMLITFIALFLLSSGINSKKAENEVDKLIKEAEKLKYESENYYKRYSESKSKMEDLYKQILEKTGNDYMVYNELFEFYFTKEDTLFKARKYVDKILKNKKVKDLTSNKPIFYKFWIDNRISEFYNIKKLKSRMVNDLKKLEREGEYFENMYMLWAMICMRYCEKEETLQLIDKSEKLDKSADKETLNLFRNALLNNIDLNKDECEE